MPDTPFTTDLRALLQKHNILAPRFAYGARGFNPDKPQLWYSGPIFDTEEIVAATGALVEGHWSVSGEHVNRFEREFAKAVGQKHSVMVNSGSSADLLMIAAVKQRLAWSDGDCVIVSPAGFPTTISALTLNRLKPLFADIEMDTLNFDLNEVERMLKADRLRHIKAILISPVLGNPPDIDWLLRLARDYNVTLLLDGCDSLDSRWRGQSLDSYCHASTCSFFPAHHVSTLQGGMISSNDAEIIRIATSMATWGRSCFCRGAGNLLPKGTCGQRFSHWIPELDMEVDHRYTYATSSAYNLLPLDLQGAIGLAQLKKLAAIAAARREVHDKVWATLSRIPDIRTATVLPHSDPCWFGVPMICPSYEVKRRLVTHLEAAGVQTRNYFAGNILMHQGYRHLGDYTLYPNANKVLSEVFFVGCPPFFGDDHIAYLSTVVDRFLLDNQGQS